MKQLLDYINESIRIEESARIDEAHFNINGSEQYSISGEGLAMQLGFKSMDELLKSKHPILKQNVIAEIKHHINGAGTMFGESIFESATIYMRDNFTGWEKYKDAVAAAKMNKISSKSNLTVRGNGPRYKVATGKFSEMVEHCMYYVKKDQFAKDIRVVALVSAEDEDKGTGNDTLDWIIANYRYNNSKSRPMDTADFEIKNEGNKTIVNYIGKKVVSTTPKTKTLTDGKFKWGTFNAGLICGKLTESLIGSPEEVNGDFDCSDTKITTLKGAPKKVNGDFKCYSTSITDFNHFPKEIGGGVYCGSNNVTSLKGVPKKINGEFSCSNTNITTLEGGPKEVKGSFRCNYCSSITTLEGSPKEVKGSFSCNHCNLLVSLEGAPKEVGRDFDCGNCDNLVSLAGSPKEIGGWFSCPDCQRLTSLEGAPENVKGSFDCRTCIALTSLEGAPKKIGYDLICYECPQLKSLDTDSEIGGKICSKDRWS